jgi:hypothetical protein
VSTGRTFPIGVRSADLACEPSRSPGGYDPSPVIHRFQALLGTHSLDRRITDIDTLNTELAAWQHATNTDQRQVDWQFTTADARIKLRHLYPTLLDATVY